MEIMVGAVDATEDVLTSIARFNKRIWPDADDIGIEKVRWAFGGNPLGRAPLLVATGKSGEVLGVRGGIPWSVDLGDGLRRTAVQLHGTGIDESIRRRGVFSRMTRDFLELSHAQRIPLIFNVSVSASRAGYERLGWTYVDSLRSMFLPVRPDRIVPELLGGKPRTRADWSFDPTPPPVYSDITALLERRNCELSGGMHTTYDSNFFSWRFDSDKYRWLGNAESGLIVYRVRSRGTLRELLIGDVWPGVKSVHYLIRRAILKERPDLVTSWTTTEHPLYRRLRRMGFLVQPGRALHLGLRHPDGRTPSMRCALMAADIDTF